MNPALRAATRYLGALALVLSTAAGQAAPPPMLNYQGFLTNPAGAPVTNPAVPMSFALFAAPSGGSPLWAESQSVAVAGGVFNVLLGTGSLTAGSPLASLPFDAPYFLEITAGGETLSPRRPLTSSPYAFRAGSLDPAATVEGVVPPGFMILGTSEVAPPGFDHAGFLGSLSLFVRQGVPGQAIVTSVPELSVLEGSSQPFTVFLAQAPTANVTVVVDVIDPAIATVSPPSLTFTPANHSTPQALTVAALQDAGVTDNPVLVRLGAAGLPSVYVYVTSLDDDVQAIVRSVPALSVLEGSVNTFTVNLGAPPASNVTVNVASNNTLVATASPPSLLFTPADFATPQTVNVQGIHDANVAGDSATVNLTAFGVASTSVAVSVVDDDLQQLVTSEVEVTVAENGTKTFTVQLAFQPAGNVTVTVAMANTAAATAGPATLTFTPGNYAVPQTVTVTGVQDANTTHEATTITLSAPGITPRTLDVNVTDDD